MGPFSNRGIENLQSQDTACCRAAVLTLKGDYCDTFAATWKSQGLVCPRLPVFSFRFLSSSLFQLCFCKRGDPGIGADFFLQERRKPRRGSQR